MPLLEGLDGAAKMSKTAGNTIGVTEEPAEMFGKAMRARRAHGEVLPARHRPAPRRGRRDRGGAGDGELHPGETKRRLAREIVTLYHSAAEAPPPRSASTPCSWPARCPRTSPRSRWAATPAMVPAHAAAGGGAGLQRVGGARLVTDGRGAPRRRPPRRSDGRAGAPSSWTASCRWVNVDSCAWCTPRGSSEASEVADRGRNFTARREVTLDRAGF
jgi:hypothetical protein